MITHDKLLFFILMLRNDIKVFRIIDYLIIMRCVRQDEVEAS